MVDWLVASYIVLGGSLAIFAVLYFVIREAARTRLDLRDREARRDAERAEKRRLDRLSEGIDRVERTLRDHDAENVELLTEIEHLRTQTGQLNRELEQRRADRSSIEERRFEFVKQLSPYMFVAAVAAIGSGALFAVAHTTVESHRKGERAVRILKDVCAKADAREDNPACRDWGRVAPEK